MVSIIVPVYNVGEPLKRCLNSLISQSYKDTEIILVDDGSKDRSLEICKEYAQKDNRVKVFSKTNSGASATRNYGIEHSSGELIAFCDADDYVETDWISAMVGHSQSADLVVLSYYKHVKNSIEKKELSNGFFKGHEYNDKCNELLKNVQFGYLWSMLFKRSILQDIRFNENMIYQEDLDFILRYASKINSIATSSYLGYHYFYQPRRKYCHTIEGIDSILFSIKLIVPENEYTYYQKHYGSAILRILLKKQDEMSICKVRKRCHKHGFIYCKRPLDYILYKIIVGCPSMITPIVLKTLAKLKYIL